MNQKHVTLAACLLAFGLAAQAQNGGISPDMLKKFRIVIRIRLRQGFAECYGRYQYQGTGIEPGNQKALNTDSPLRWNQRGSPISSRLAVAGCLRD